MHTALPAALPILGGIQPSAEQSAKPDVVGEGAPAVKIPGWFKVGAALRVARLKGVEYLLVLDRSALAGVVGVRTLAGVSPSDPVARWMSASTLSILPDMARDEARRLMDCLGLDCLPVASGVLLLGLITRRAIEDHVRPAVGGVGPIP